MRGFFVAPAAVISGDRVFDVWGGVRTGTATTMGTCANLGHKADLESGLIYMRARYYEPGSGRFASEDPGHQGSNWFAYCGCSPVKYIDSTGRFFEEGPELLWFNHVGRDPMFGKQVQDIVQQFQSGAIGPREAAQLMGAIWYNLATNFYPCTVAGVSGTWKLCVRVPKTLVDILTESFDWGEGISGDIVEIIEEAAQMTFQWLESYRG